MLHTFLDPDRDGPRGRPAALQGYLGTSPGLGPARPPAWPRAWTRRRSTGGSSTPGRAGGDRYFETGGLFGTARTGGDGAEVVGIGVDEVACLIDFGVDTDAVLAALPHLDRLKDTFDQELEGR